MTRQAPGSRQPWLRSSERSSPQGCDRFWTSDGHQAVGEVARGRPRVGLGLFQKSAYGTQILDVLPAMSTVDKVAEQPFSV